MKPCREARPPRAASQRQEEQLPLDQHGEARFTNSPTGPRVAPRPSAVEPPAQPLRRTRGRRPYWSIIIFILLISGIGIRAYRDLSRSDSWAYWKDQYYAPRLASSLIASADIDGSGLDGSSHGRPALAISGTIGAAAASWLRNRLDEAHLAAGDAVLLSSPGGDLNQALIMGEIIRSRGLATAVAVADSTGHLRPAYCASACVLVYAGGKPRYGLEGSMLGVHRFVASNPVHDPMAEAQRISGTVLGYMTKMGVSSTIVEAMSQTRDVRWLGAKEAVAMNLVTDPVGRH
jgi:hypothetical protein